VRENPFLKHPADSLRRALDVSRGLQFRQNPRSLYYASAPMRREGNAAASLSPITLQEIMPHLISSDYDYIVFDLPPIGPTSPALAVAGFMDKVLLVVDGECTTRENLNWAYTELERGRADVSCIFNKARTHAPRWVQGEV
jgi:ATPases involved in chromosome partitioning